jgi:hypothetical protein
VELFSAAMSYFFHAIPTFVVVLIYFVRTEARLTRIETTLEFMSKGFFCAQDPEQEKTHAD